MQESLRAPELSATSRMGRIPIIRISSQPTAFGGAAPGPKPAGDPKDRG